VKVELDDIEYRDDEEVDEMDETVDDGGELERGD
jgi:hypothetical protein